MLRDDKENFTPYSSSKIYSVGTTKHLLLAVCLVKGVHHVPLFLKPSLRLKVTYHQRPHCILFFPPENNRLEQVAFPHRPVLCHECDLKWLEHSSPTGSAIPLRSQDREKWSVAEKDQILRTFTQWPCCLLHGRILALALMQLWGRPGFCKSP